MMTMYAVNAQTEDLSTFAKPKVRFRWSGIFGSNCDTGQDCGSCIGFCVIFRARSASDAANEHAQNEIGDLALKVISKSQIMGIPSQSCDNGNGTVTLTDDLIVDNSFSSILGKTNVKLLKGTYTIDYSNTSYTFGKIIFNYSGN